MKTEIISQTPPKTLPKLWNKFQKHPLQLWEWGDFRRKTGVNVIRIGIYDKERLTDGWQLTFHRVPYTDFSVGYFPKGPEISEFMIKELIKLGKQNNAIYIQIEPNILENRHNNITIHQYNNILSPSHHPLFTQYNYILDLTKPEHELLQSMHSKTRYNIRLAQKKGVVIRQDNSAKGFENYLKLVQETLTRQKYYAHDLNYHRKMWDTLNQAGIAKLWTANYQDQTLAAWIIFVWKDSIYYPYGASSRKNKEVMAPNLLLWEIAKFYRKNGYKKFDLWGALGTDPDPDDPWYGFNRFKAGYSPEHVKYQGSSDLIIKPFIYQAFCLVDNLRWKFLRAKI